MKSSLQNILDTRGIMVIDGSMSTALENMGLDLNHRLWTARALAENPEQVKQVHINYFRAGADCGITCSYQASIPGLTGCGYTEAEAEVLIRRSVELFLEARDEWWEKEGRDAGRVWPLCLAGMGPYGAYLADGSEYTGAYQVSDEELYEFHARRARLLWEAGADILLFETQPSLHETLLEARIAEEMSADYWVSFSCRDGEHNGKGEPVTECASTLSQGHPHLKIIDNGTDFRTKLEKLIAEIVSFLGEPDPMAIERKFLIAYPDIDWLESLPNCTKVEIEQTYLKSSPDIQIRLRKRGIDGHYIYYRSEKRPISPTRRVVLEERLSESAYIKQLADADPEARPVRKTRYCLAENNRYYEIDLYPEWKKQAVLEIELRNAEEAVILPEGIHMIREVTGDRRYKNSSLARAMVAEDADENPGSGCRTE